MPGKLRLQQKVAASLIYSRPLLVFLGMICAIDVMWTRNPIIYTCGVVLMFTSMSFDLVDGWFAARFRFHSNLAHLADRIMDKIVYSIIFPLIAVGVMWRLYVNYPEHANIELLHAIFVLLLCVTVLIRDNFAHFMRGIAIRKGQEPEFRGLNRLRTIVAAPVGALLYAHAFYVPEGPPSQIYFWISWLGNFPLRGLFFIEILFLIINFGSIAGYLRKYGTYFMDELCLGDELLRRRVLAIFPNALTVMNAMMGLLAVLFAYQGQIREAYLILIGAALFDKLDGVWARKLGLTTPHPDVVGTHRASLGSILDDIADAVSFCIAPAWIFYISLSGFSDPVIQKLPLGLVSLLYAVLGITRLIYFTVDRNPIPGFFKGMPTPAAAMLVVAPLIMFSQAIEDGPGMARFWGIFSFGLMILAAFLMNLYPVRYLHLGRFMGRHPWFGRMTLILILIFILTPYFGYAVLSYMVLYMLSPLVSRGIEPDIAAMETRVRPDTST